MFTRVHCHSCLHACVATHAYTRALLLMLTYVHVVSAPGDEQRSFMLTRVNYYSCLHACTTTHAYTRALLLMLTRVHVVSAS